MNTRSSNPQANQQRLIQFAPNAQGKLQAATYATVKEAIVQHVQKTFVDGQDVAQSLKEGKEFDLSAIEPVRVISEEQDSAKAALAQSGLDIKYQEELRRYLDRKDNLRKGLTKAYALIFGNYCSRTMQSRVEEHPEFETKIENNPIELLEVIKVLMHDPVRAQYPMISMTEALTRLMNTKQANNEQLLDYIKRFKQTRDVAVSHLGTDLLNKFAEYQEEYKAFKTKKKGR